MHDTINSPSWYTRGKIEVIEFIEDQGLPYHLSCVIKYVTRAGHKDETKTLEDLKKARWYLDRYIQWVEATPPAADQRPDHPSQTTVDLARARSVANGMESHLVLPL
jgi:Protein of unknwon function (DUF3310)